MTTFDPNTKYTVYIHTMPYMVLHEASHHHYYACQITIFAEHMINTNMILLINRQSEYFYTTTYSSFEYQITNNESCPTVLESMIHDTENITFVQRPKSNMK